MCQNIEAAVHYLWTGQAFLDRVVCMLYLAFTIPCIDICIVSLPTGLSKIVEFNSYLVPASLEGGIWNAKFPA